MSIGVASVQHKKNLLLRDAVIYYREQRFAAESAVVVVGQVFSIGNLAQCLNISKSGTVSDIRNSGTTMANFGSNSIAISDFENSRKVYDFSNSTILNMSN